MVIHLTLSNFVHAHGYLLNVLLYLVRYLVDISLNERTTTDHQDQIQSKPKERILFLVGRAHFRLRLLLLLEGFKLMLIPNKKCVNRYRGRYGNTTAVCIVKERKCKSIKPSIAQ